MQKLSHCSWFRRLYPPCNLTRRAVLDAIRILGCITLIFAFCVIVNSAHALDSISFDTEFGGKGSGAGGFSKNIHINFDADNNIYISDADNKMVQKLSPDGQFIMQIPKEKADELLFNKPGDICVDSVGNIYVADFTATHIKDTDNPKIYIFVPCVYKFSPQGELIETFFVNKVDMRPKKVLPVRVIIDDDGKPAYGIQPKDYDRPLLVDVDSQSNLYALDVKNCVVFKLAPDGSEVLHFGQYGSGKGELDNASDIEIDREDNVFIADTGNHRVLKFNSQGQLQFTIGQKGRGNREFIKPLRITAMKNGDTLVKDSSQFVRASHKYSSYSIMGGDESPGSKITRSLIPNQMLGNTSELDNLRERIRLLEEAEYYDYYYDKENGDEKGEKEEDEERKAQLLRKTLYHSVIERIQRFNTRGAYRGRVIYKIDKQSAQHHDLNFLAMDPLGRVYLRDESELTIRRYTISGITLTPSHIDAVYTARPEYYEQNFLEDYEDVDKKPNLRDEENLFNLRQSLLLNYDLSERWNVTFRDTLSYRERDAQYFVAPKQEDSYNYGDEGTENIFDANLRFITNPNPYRYKELNLYSQLLYGTTNLHRDSIFTELNKEFSRHEGDSKTLILGIDWDVLTRANLAFEYLNLDPNYTSRNFTREYYDVAGNLYQLYRSQNKASIWVGELNIKF